MPCRDTATAVRRTCRRWRTTTSLRCREWQNRTTQQCQRWETETTNRCDRWETETTNRCDRWETERRRECAGWHWLFAWMCVLFTWVTTTVCRVWVAVTTTVCRLWVAVTTTVCRLWVTVVSLVCLAWVTVVSLVCDLWVTVLDIGCTIACAWRRLFAPTEVRSSRSECVFGWTAAYRIEEDPERCRLRVTLRLRLVPDEDVSAADLAAARTRWETAIEAAWTGAHPIRRRAGDCRCEEYRVEVDVQWVDQGEHHSVRVRSGSGRADMGNWFITSTGGTAAHEAGHMLGNADEYAEADRCPDRVVTSDGSIMQDSANGTVRPRHYGDFATWVSNHTCCDYGVT